MILRLKKYERNKKCSFCIRLLKRDDDEFHENCVEYFKFFIGNNIEMYLSTIVVSEYSVGDNPENLLSLNSFRLLEFDFADAKFSGMFLSYLKDFGKFGDFGSRKVVKLFAQIHNREIDAYITKDRKSFSKMIDPLNEEFDLKFKTIVLTTPLNSLLGRLF